MRNESPCRPYESALMMVLFIVGKANASPQRSGRQSALLLHHSLCSNEENGGENRYTVLPCMFRGPARTKG